MIHDDVELPAGHVLCECKSEKQSGVAPIVPAAQCQCALFNEHCRRFGGVDADAAEALFKAVALQAWHDALEPNTNLQADARLVLEAEHGQARRVREELAQCAGVDADALREKARKR